MVRAKATKPIDDLVNTDINALIYERAAGLPHGGTDGERFAVKWFAGMATSFRERFARKLRELREQAGLSLNGLAKEAGIDHSQLLRLEAGERSCTLETAVQIAGALGVSLGILTDESLANAPDAETR